MWVFFKDLLLVSVGMGIGVVLMCILQVGKDADNVMNELYKNRFRVKRTCVSCHDTEDKSL